MTTTPDDRSRLEARRITPAGRAALRERET
jgi:hypothetical protein